MAMTPFRKNVALAIDGGGIKGTIVSTALAVLEQALGGKPLIQNPSIKVLAGTSTGSVITGAIAIGMTADETATLYRTLAQEVFPALTPNWLPDSLKEVDELRRMVFEHSLYANDKFGEYLRDSIQKKTGKADLTLEEVQEMMGPDKVLIMTTLNINERRTRFLKTYKDSTKGWTLWEAVLASSSSPAALPVFQHVDENGNAAYYSDGGVGSYGNPAYFATEEALAFRGYAPDETTILSIGTGWVNGDNYQLANGVPNDWPAVLWALKAADMFIGDNARAQSIAIMENYINRNLDFRRFQFELDQDIPGDAFGDDATYAKMVTIGQQLGARILADQFAPNEDAQYDPEQLYLTYQSYLEAQKEAQAKAQAAATSP